MGKKFRKEIVRKLYVKSRVAETRLHNRRIALEYQEEEDAVVLNTWRVFPVKEADVFKAQGFEVKVPRKLSKGVAHKAGRFSVEMFNEIVQSYIALINRYKGNNKRKEQ